MFPVQKENSNSFADSMLMFVHHRNSPATPGIKAKPLNRWISTSCLRNSRFSTNSSKTMNSWFWYSTLRHRAPAIRICPHDKLLCSHSIERPKQKHRVHPSAFDFVNPNVIASHWSHFTPCTNRLHGHWPLWSHAIAWLLFTVIEPSRLQLHLSHAG